MNYFKRYPITTYLIAINIIVFILNEISNSIYELSVLYTPFLPTQFWRLFTSMFFHFWIVHLVMNMYALSSLWATIEQLFWKKKYLLIYFVSWYAWSLMVWLIDTITQDYWVSAWASGALFWLCGALLVLSTSKYSNLKSVLDKNVIISSIWINILISFLPWISMSAHVWWLIWWILVTYALIKR